MKTSLFFIATLLTKIAFCQNLTVLPDSNYSWNVHHCCNPSTTWNYSIKGDTIINSVKYKKVLFTMDTIFKLKTAQYAGGLREDSLKRIFYKPSDEAEDILYDFNLAVNDTFKTNKFKFVVDSVGTVVINNKVRKKLSLHNSASWISRPQDWIEGIGSSFGLLEVNFTQAGDISTDLLCLYHFDTLVYSPTNYCYMNTVGINEIVQFDFQINLFPNPTKDETTMSLGIIDNYSIQIFDILGKIQFLKTFYGNTITIDNLNKGLYFVSIQNSHGQQASKKLLRE